MIAKMIVERRDECGVTWFLIDDLSRLSRNTIESLRHGKLAEATGVRVVGAIDVARLFNELKVGGKQTWSDSRVRQHCARERLVGKDVLHKSRQATDRQTGRRR